MVPGRKRIYIQVGLVPALAAVLLGLSLLSFGQVASLSNHSKTAEGFLAEGDAFLRQGQYDAAITEYTYAIQLKPDFAEAYNNRGYAAFSKYDGTLALDDLNQALRLRTNFPHAYNTRGCIHMTLGHTEEAIADFNEAMEPQPDYPRAYRNRAMMLLKKGRFSTAFADYKRAGGDPKPLIVVVAGILILIALIAFLFLRAITRLACQTRRVPSGREPKQGTRRGKI